VNPGCLTRIKIGVDLSLLDSEYCDPDVATLTHSAVEVFKSAGATVSEVRLPFFDELSAATMYGLVGEALAYHREDMLERWADYGRRTRLAIGRAMLMTAADYVQLQRVRRVGIGLTSELFTNYDLLVTPTCLIPGPLIEDGWGPGELWTKILTPYWNATGNPAMSIPMGLTSHGLPAGLQIAGRPFDESTVFRAADAFQLLTDHHLQESPIVMEMLA
jgi:aspartyl-tRNA(Asn)/glutamyl-tRNA(Gln) amidotransferase subunit A